MDENWAGHNVGKVILGLTIIAFGVIFLLGNLNVIQAHHYLRYWPVILIAFGLAKLLNPRRSGGRMFGFIVGTVGVLLLLQEFGKITWSLWALWPLLLVLLGLNILWGGFGRGFGRHPRGMGFRPRFRYTTTFGSAPGGPMGNPMGSPIGNPTGDPTDSTDRQIDPDSTLHISSVFGGNERLVTSQDFRGGTISTIMGGCDIDFRQASIVPGGEATIDLSVVFGGIEIRVPEDWKVVVRLSSFIGGVDDRTRKPTGDAVKTLVITGSIVFGGLEVRN